MGIQVQGRGFQRVRREPPTKERMDGYDKRRELLIAQVTQTLDPLRPQLDGGRDRLKWRDLGLRKKVDPISVEEETEIRRELFRVP